MLSIVTESKEEAERVNSQVRMILNCVDLPQAPFTVCCGSCV
jgi:hypothetical protein